jgi:hypothetical protein
VRSRAFRWCWRAREAGPWLTSDLHNAPGRRVLNLMVTRLHMCRNCYCCTGRVIGQWPGITCTLFHYVASLKRDTRSSSIGHGKLVYHSPPTKVPRFYRKTRKTIRRPRDSRGTIFAMLSHHVSSSRALSISASPGVGPISFPSNESALFVASCSLVAGYRPASIYRFVYPFSVGV